jgi:hypothetical protein
MEKTSTFHGDTKAEESTTEGKYVVGLPLFRLSVVHTTGPLSLANSLIYITSCTRICKEGAVC